MKLSMKPYELSDTQCQIIANANPDWMADHRPEWMAINRPEWMADNRPWWMAYYRPEWMATYKSNNIPNSIMQLLPAGLRTAKQKRKK